MITSDHKLEIFDTLHGEKRLFEPLDQNNVTMYVCGPTVYDRPHIGNIRSVITYDVLYRILKKLYKNVTYARNITDVDDKIIHASNEQNIAIETITSEATKQFHKDIEYLNCIRPTIEPQATNEITDMIEMISKLVSNGHAYIAEQNVMFDVNSYSQYGQLSHRKIDEMISGSRIHVEDYKRCEYDFVLWKKVTKTEYGWDSPFGYGRPGWHIECSSMSTKYLGTTFDIHGGGIDLQFPHHENEIAQSCCAYTGSQFARYWIHNGFLTINGEKMSKSIGNITNVSDLRIKGMRSDAIRFALLSTHYRKPLNFTDHLIETSISSIEKFSNLISSCETITETIIPQEALNCLLDDINLSKYIAIMFSYFRDARDTTDANGKKDLITKLYTTGKFIGLFNNIEKDQNENNDKVDDEITKLLELRRMFRTNKNFRDADLIRDQIKKLGFDIVDSNNTTHVVKSKD